MLHVDIRCQRCGATLPLPLDPDRGCPLCYERDARADIERTNAIRGERFYRGSTAYWKAFAAEAVKHLTEAQQIDAHNAGIAAKERETR